MLKLGEEVLGAEHVVVSIFMIELAISHHYSGQHAQAIPLYQRALAFSEKTQGPKHPDTGASLNNLARLFQDMGQFTQALPLYQRAQAIVEKTKGLEHPDTGTSLNNLASLYQAMGQYAQALPLHLRAERIAFSSNDRGNLWQAQIGLALLYSKQKQPTAAIFWAKQAVNTIQSLRAGLVKMDRELQSRFLKDKRWVYTGLSQWLIDAGRIPESQRVMALLKEEELFDFVRRDASASLAQSELPLTGVER